MPTLSTGSYSADTSSGCSPARRSPYPPLCAMRAVLGGCHSGLSVPDAWDDAGLALDSARPGAHGFHLGGHTGYGYGMDDVIALSEQLMSFLAQELGRAAGVAVGEALMRAKQRYINSMAAAAWECTTKRRSSSRRCMACRCGGRRAGSGAAMAEPSAQVLVSQSALHANRSCFRVR